MGNDNAYAGCWGLSNISGVYTVHDMINNTHGLMAQFDCSITDNRLRIYAICRFTGVYDTYAESPATYNPRYFKMVRSGTTLTLYIYSDATRTTLLDTLTTTCSSQVCRYIIASCGADSTINTKNISWDLEDLDLNPTTTTTDKNIPNYFNSKFITYH